MLLKNKVIVVYGAGGAIGGAVSRAFAGEGARVHLTGRKRAPLETVAAEIERAGGFATIAEVDAFDEPAIDRHLESVMRQEGRLDVSFNAVGYPAAEILGVPFTELDAARFSAPIFAYTRSYFLTARLAARRMIPAGAGAIMTVTAIPGRAATPLNGGYGPAMAAKEALTRDLSAEFAPHGVRVVGLRPHGMPETPTIKTLFEIKARPAGRTWEQFQEYLANLGHARRGLRLEELAHLAVFLASDRASGMTGTTVNLTLGAAAD